METKKPEIESPEIDIRQIWEKAANTTDNINRNVAFLKEPNCTKEVAKLLKVLIVNIPGLAKYLSILMDLAIASMSFAFEAGRLYGREEIKLEDLKTKVNKESIQ